MPSGRCSWALVGTLLGIAAFRGLIDVLAHKLIPAPSLYGAERELRSEDVVVAAAAVVLAPQVPAAAGLAWSASCSC